MFPQIDYSVSSPNWSERSEAIDTLVYHATAGRKPGDFQRLTDDTVPLKQRVSVHYYVDKAGTVYQLVKEENVAWHAGVSSWNGKTNINENSVGIELENLNDGADPYPSVQIASAMALGADIIRRRNIQAINVVRHVDIAPGRKTDPRDAAGFSWVTFQASLVWWLFSAVGTTAPPPEQRQWSLYRQYAANAYRIGAAFRPATYFRVGVAVQVVILMCERGCIYGVERLNADGSFREGKYYASV